MQRKPLVIEGWEMGSTCGMENWGLGDLEVRRQRSEVGGRSSGRGNKQSKHGTLITLIRLISTDSNL
jgi:hypothetical protein